MNKVDNCRFVAMHRKRVLSEILNYVNANSDITSFESDNGALFTIRHSKDNNYLGSSEFFKGGRIEDKIDYLLLKFAKINRARIIDELLKD